MRSKSQLAIEYAHRVRRQSPDTSVFWLYASNAARVEESYKGVAELLSLPGRKDPSTNVMQLVVDYLNSNESGKWLMIVDNVDTQITIQSRQGNNTVDVSLAKFLPQSDNGSILITSRYHDVSRTLVGREKDMISVATMDKTEALQLLKNKLSTPVGDEATALVEELDCIPLAVSQAAAYINRMQPRMSIEKYIEKLKDVRKRHKLLMHAVPDDRRDDQASSSPLGTWQITFEHIQAQSSSAADLLAFMSFFNRHGIPEFMMKHYKDSINDNDDDDSDNNDDDDESSRKSVDNQSTKSSRHEGVGKIVEELSENSEHRAEEAAEVQAESQPEPGIQWTATEHTLRPESEEEVQAAPAKVNSDSSSSAHQQSSEDEDGSTDDDDEESNANEDGNESEDEAFEDDVALLSGFSLITTNNRGKDFQMHGLVQVAMRTQLQESNTEEIVGRRFINALYQEFPVVAFENWPRCRALFPHVDLEVEKITTRKGDIRKWADVLYQAAWYLEEQGFFRSAETMVKDSLALTERTFGKENNTTLDHLNLLGDVLDDLGDYTEAEATYRECLELREKAFGKKNPPTRTMHNLAITLRKQEKHTDAEKLFREVLDYEEKHYDRKFTMLTRNNLAVTIGFLERYEEAEKLHREVLAWRKVELGDGHPDTLNCVNDLALALDGQGRFDEAEELHRNTLNELRVILGPKHPQTLRSLYNLARILSRQGRFEDAIELYKEALADREVVLGMKHPDTQRVRDALAWCRKRQADAQARSSRQLKKSSHRERRYTKL